jgi:hypothetical protein
MKRRMPLKRSGPPARKTKPRVKRAAGPRRTSATRNGDYLAFLRKQWCLACISQHNEALRWDRLPHPISLLSDAAHGPSAGMAEKGDDSGAIPLCRSCHRLQHDIGWPAFEERFHFSRAHEAARLFKLFRGKD